MPLPESSGDALDPRLLIKKVNELETRMKTLEANSIAFNAHQQGPIPGFLRAVQINDTNQAGAMWTNYTNAGPGLGPYSAVTDPNGVIRAEWGNLAVNGNSPAQYGFRANTGGGVPIFDSLGLINVMSVLINTTANTQTLNPTFGGGFQTITWNDPTTFTVPRTVNVLCIASFVGNNLMTAGSEVAYSITLGIDSGSSPDVISSFAIWDTISTGAQANTNGACFELKSLNAGSHTIKAYVDMSAFSGGPITSQFNLDGGFLFVFQLGN